jgi:hypothetical protein
MLDAANVATQKMGAYLGLPSDIRNPVASQPNPAQPNWITDTGKVVSGAMQLPAKAMELPISMLPPDKQELARAEISIFDPVLAIRRAQDALMGKTPEELAYEAGNTPLTEQAQKPTIRPDLVEAAQETYDPIHHLLKKVSPNLDVVRQGAIGGLVEGATALTSKENLPLMAFPHSRIISGAFGITMLEAVSRELTDLNNIYASNSPENIEQRSPENLAKRIAGMTVTTAFLLMSTSSALKPEVKAALQDRIANAKPEELKQVAVLKEAQAKQLEQSKQKIQSEIDALKVDPAVTGMSVTGVNAESGFAQAD